MLTPLLAILGLMAPQTYDILIRGGKVVDGTGNPWVRADVALRGERIAAVGQLSGAKAKRVIEATGLVVSPGFIDMLGHSEYNLLVDPRALSKVSQGITTEITGEGTSLAPLSPRLLGDLRDVTERFGIHIDWTTFDGYFRRLERQGTATNLGTYVGATQVRKYVVGYEDRRATPQELEAMKRLVAQGMEEGALGLSTALIYPPATFAPTEELIELAKIAASYGGIYATHMRNEGSRILEALEEAFQISREAGIPVEIFHLKVSGASNWGRMAEILQKIEAAREEGLDITADQYSYTASATSLRATLPAWTQEGGRPKLLERLRDAKLREKIRHELVSEEGGRWRPEAMGIAGPEGILIRSAFKPENRIFEGKTLVEAAAQMGKDPLEALFDLLLADEGETGAIYFSMDEGDVRLAMRAPWVSVDTDFGAVSPTGPLGESKVHPRAYGTFPRILGRYVREEEVLRLEEAIRKMTSLPAQRLRLRDRGLVKEGYYADLVLFNPETVLDLATFQDPHQLARGVEYVLVNGRPVWEGGQTTGALPGKVLRGPGFK